MATLDQESIDFVVRFAKTTADFHLTPDDADRISGSLGAPVKVRSTPEGYAVSVGGVEEVNARPWYALFSALCGFVAAGGKLRPVDQVATI